MTRVLYINASPRGDESASTQAAETFLSALDSAVKVEQVPLFEAGLPDYTPTLAAAKQVAGMGGELSAEQALEWANVTRLVEQFAAADHYLFAVPMWNFGVPYVLKQYIDLLTHPGLTFSYGAKGMRGLVSGSATVIYARGGDYSPKDGRPDPFDFQSPYMEAWLNLVGITPISTVLVQRTMSGPDALEVSLREAGAALSNLAQQVSVDA